MSINLVLFTCLIDHIPRSVPQVLGLLFESDKLSSVEDNRLLPMALKSALPPLDHANFAVISRLISCLVTERVLPAFYISLEQPVHGAFGLMVVLSTHTISNDINAYRPYCFEDIFVMILLRHPPVFRDSQTRKHGQLIGLVDPLDMLPRAYGFGNGDHDVNVRYLCVYGQSES